MPPTSPAIRLVCSGCRYGADPAEPYPFRCRQARPGDDVDHVLRRVLDAAAVGSPAEARGIFLADEPNPFLQFRRLLHSYETARAGGLSDTEFVQLVAELDAAVGRVDGCGFGRTPFSPSPALAQRLGVGRVWVKDETGNVAGSHKGRHFMGIQLWLAVVQALGRAPTSPPLAVASCGNAALAAAVVAKAAGRPLRVFIPPDAEPAVVERLRALGAELEVCPRRPGELGDPCFHRFQEATARGALPFTCQGSENGLAIEGGETLAWEMVAVLLRDGLELDHLVVQVGGGALASACVQGFQEARALGVVSRLPRIHTVQTASAHPLERAYERLTEQIALRMGRRLSMGGSVSPVPDWIRCELPESILRAELDAAATRRSAFMRPWESEPRSIARGILDDETYDWLAVAEGMLATGGVPLVVSESTLAEANALAVAATAIPVDPTGSAGLAGCLELARRGAFTAGESVAAVFTGGRRHW